MNLQIKGQENTTVVIELRMDDGDVDLLVNGELVAYFKGNGQNKTHLEMVLLTGKAKQFVKADEDGFIVARR
jgi:hypothetical protein